MSTLRLCECCARKFHQFDIDFVDQGSKRKNLGELSLRGESVLPVVFDEDFVSCESNSQRESQKEIFS